MLPVLPWAWAENWVRSCASKFGTKPRGREAFPMTMSASQYTAVQFWNGYLQPVNMLLDILQLELASSRFLLSYWKGRQAGAISFKKIRSGTGHCLSPGSYIASWSICAVESACCEKASSCFMLPHIEDHASTYSRLRKPAVQIFNTCKESWEQDLSSHCTNTISKKSQYWQFEKMHGALQQWSPAALLQRKISLVCQRIIKFGMKSCFWSRDKMLSYLAFYQKLVWKTAVAMGRRQELWVEWAALLWSHAW